MARNATENKEDSFDEKLFKFLFNSRFDPNVLNDEQILDWSSIDGGTEDVKSYDEYRNRLISKLQKAGNADILDEAIEAYNLFYGDENDAVKSFTKELFPRVSTLKMRELGYDNSSSDELNKELENVAGFLNMDVPALLEKITDGKGVSSEKLKELLYKDILIDANKKEKLYRDLGYVMPDKGDDYLIDNLSTLLGRAKKIKDWEAQSTGQKIANNFVAPFSSMKMAEGMKPTALDVGSDLVNLGIDGLAAYVTKGKSLPSKISASATLNILPELIHQYKDSSNTEHVYSLGEGDNDIRKKGDVDAVFSLDNVLPKLAGSAILSSAPYLGKQFFPFLPNLKKIKDSNAYQNIGNGLRVAIDKIFGSNGTKKKIAELEAEAKDLKRLNEGFAKEHDAFFSNRPKGVDEESVRSGLKQTQENNVRLDEIDKELENLYNSSEFKNSKNATDALDFILNFLFLKGTESNTKKKRDATGENAINFVKEQF